MGLDIPPPYAYDTQGQLLTAKVYNAGGTLQKTYTYTYDTVGNLLTASDGSTAHTYAYGDEQWRDLLTAYDGHAITYDQTGNPLTYYDGSAFTWKNGRQLASWTKNGQTTSYTYNADGLRTKKVNPDGSWSEYHWIGSTLISENRFRANGERHWTLQFQYDQNGSPVGVSFRDCGESTFTYVYYYAKNLQGDIVGLYKKNPDGTGTQVIATYEYDPWGKVTAVRDANGNLVTYPSGSNLIAFMNPLRYRGYYQDNDTGFYYLQSRYYDPELKRFINADSYASTGHGFIRFNMFAYCCNRPINQSDLNGKGALDGLKKGIKWIAEKVGKPVVKFVERKMSKVQATYSTGYAASATLFGLGEISGQFGVTMDTSGNVALQYSYAGGITTGGLGASVTRYSSITNAPGYEALNGLGYQVGGAFAFLVSGVPVAVGGDFNIIENTIENTNDPGKSYYGITGNVGFGTPGGEMHVLWGETQTIEGTQFNIFEVASDIYTRIMEW